MKYLTLFFLPVSALAQNYECTSVKYSDQIAAFLQFSADARSGRLESEYRNGFPPVGLVDAPIRFVGTKGGILRYESEKDRLTQYSASLEVPVGFQQRKKFEGRLSIHTPKESLRYEMSCQ